MKQPTEAGFGFYGKVPAYGDFLNRHMPSSFVAPWDAWLSRSISASRALLRDGWTEAYLTSPPWRFMLEPGLAGGQAWIGVLASSVDKVRRAFPITVAMTLPEASKLASNTVDIDSIAMPMEQIALQLIDGSLDADGALQALAALRESGSAGRSSRTPFENGDAGRLYIGGHGRTLASMTRLLLGDGPPTTDDACSLWWHDEWRNAPTCELLHRGLPSPESFASMLDQRWAERGWRPVPAASQG